MNPADPLCRNDNAPANGFTAQGEEDDVAGLLLRPAMPRDREAVLLVAFDAHQRLIAYAPVDGPGADRCTIAPRHWRLALHAGTRHLLMAHNHPSGDPRPSQRDIECTREAAAFLTFLDINLIDHLIFTDAGHFSFRRAGLL